MNNTFFIADLHFSDNSIIEYENRPYDSIEKMNEDLIMKWNKVVTNEDIIFILGDFGFSNNEKLIEIGNKLQGKKTLITGNHDTESNEFYFKCGFENVYNFPIIFDDFWILSHNLMYINKNMPYGNIFGHVHDNPAIKDFSKQSFCVSVERINYAPISFEEIKKRVSK